MLFKPKHKEMILAGSKTVTRRVWKRPMVKIGGIYKAKLKMLSKDFFAKIKVTNLFKQRLGNITFEECKKEGYDSKPKFIDTWAKINGSWREDLIVYVIEFEVVK